MKGKFFMLGGVLMLAAALIIGSATTPAMADEMWNGNFDQGALGWPTGSTQHNMVGTTYIGQTALGADTSLSYNNFQIIDAAYLGDSPTQYTQLNSSGSPWPSMPANKLGSANPGWIAGGTSETYTFSFQYATIGSGHGDVQLFYYGGSGIPPYDVNSPARLYQPNGTLSPGWNLLYDSGSLSSTTGWMTVNVPTTTIPGGIQPEFFGIILSKSGSGSAYFDTISLDTECTAAVPLPGAFLLLGAGLTRLAAYARRKRAQA